ncbi:MAG: L,D-transpeptidase [Nitrospirae bacterium]|nr:L,D-transpeptidase [Nitrospirota bacterium]
MSRKKIIQITVIVIASIFISLEAAGYYLAHRAWAAEKREAEETSKGSGASGKKKSLEYRQKLGRLSPKGIHIIIDTAENRLYLRDGDKTIVNAVISTGSGSILTDPSGKREWIFDTPRGEYAIKSKVVDPSWIKPDWAFIEEGEDIPKNFQERVENGMLGKYALAFGNGYFIHGTLYKRLLGRNVTHGCVRVGDDDLETVFKQAPIGAKVIIF